MPAEFNRSGIRFQFPENWTLDENDARGGQSSVTVYSPAGAFWSVSRHAVSTDPKQLAEAVVQAMQEEYKDLEVSEASDSVAGRQMIGYDLDFFYLDLVVIARVRCLQTESGTYAVFCQAEDSDYDRLGAVFLAMTTSLLGNVGRPT